MILGGFADPVSDGGCFVVASLSCDPNGWGSVQGLQIPHPVLVSHICIRIVFIPAPRVQVVDKVLTSLNYFIQVRRNLRKCIQSLLFLLSLLFLQLAFGIVESYFLIECHLAFYGGLQDLMFKLHPSLFYYLR